MRIFLNPGNEILIKYTLLEEEGLLIGYMNIIKIEDGNYLENGKCFKDIILINKDNKSGKYCRYNPLTLGANLRNNHIRRIWDNTYIYYDYPIIDCILKARDELSGKNSFTDVKIDYDPKGGYKFKYMDNTEADN
jgi:hypothetical protein